MLDPQRRDTHGGGPPSRTTRRTCSNADLISRADGALSV
jgi:hypothetical protein